MNSGLRPTVKTLPTGDSKKIFFLFFSFCFRPTEPHFFLKKGTKNKESANAPLTGSAFRGTERYHLNGAVICLLTR